MALLDMTKEELIAEIERLNKELYHKKAARLSWKSILKGTELRKGPNYWTNGHFLLMDEVEMPKALALTPICDIDIPLLSVYDVTIDRVSYPSDQWKTEGDKVIMPNGVRFQKKYITMLDKLVPGYYLAPAALGVMAAATIAKGDKFLGVLMPVGEGR